MRAENILQTIGNTPHIRVNRLFGNSHEVWIKSERANPGGSIKDRIALSMIEAAEASGALKPGSTIIEPTKSLSSPSKAITSTLGCLAASSCAISSRSSSVNIVRL